MSPSRLRRIAGRGAGLLLGVGAMAGASEPPMNPDASMTTILGKAYAGGWRPESGRPAPLYEIRLVAEKGPGVDRLRASNLDRSGRAVVEQVVTFEEGRPTSYAMTNASADLEAGVQVTGNQAVMKVSRGGKAKQETKPLPRLYSVGPAIGRLVEQHIGELRAARSIELGMIAVNRLEVFDVRVLRDDPAGTEPIPEVVSGTWLRLRLEPANALFRVFAPKIQFIVDAQSGALKCVIGPIPESAASESTIQGTICYGPPTSARP